MSLVESVCLSTISTLCAVSAAIARPRQVFGTLKAGSLFQPLLFPARFVSGIPISTFASEVPKACVHGLWSTSCFSRRPHGGPLPRPAAPKIRDQHARYISTRPADRLADFPGFFFSAPLPFNTRHCAHWTPLHRRRLGPIAEKKKVAFFYLRKIISQLIQVRRDSSVSSEPASPVKLVSGLDLQNRPSLWWNLLNWYEFICPVLPPARALIFTFPDPLSVASL